jgi:hypothetical protein
MRNVLTTLAEVLGMSMVTFGVGIFSVPAGVITGGVCFLAIGLGAGA